jgi:hypothetical protein
MRHDLARALLDQPNSESARETAGPARDITISGSPHRDRRRPSALVGWLLLAIAGLGFFISTPPSGGPDEPVHETTAWYLSGHGLRLGPTEWFSVPESFSADPCFKGSYVVASCAPPRSSAQMTVSTSMVLNYAPPYYWVVGIGERLAVVLVGTEYADVGGRLASFLLNFGALLLLSLYMRRRNQWWGTLLLLVSTPMAVFMGTVVNPNGWEVTCGLAMAAVLSEAVWNRRSLESGALPKATTLLLVVASVALCLARPVGLVWASGLTVSAVALAPSTNRRLFLRVACAVAPGLALGIVWALISRSTAPGVGNGLATNPETVSNLVFWFALSLLLFPIRLWEMVGVLGWLDTPTPLPLFLTTVVAWGALLSRLPSIRRAAAVCGIFGIVVLPGAIETASWAYTGQWWQGRYTLPFALGFGLLLLLRSGHLVPRAISFVSGFSLLSLGLMIWVNAIRYDFGVDFFGFPHSLEQQGISSVRLLLSVVVGSLLLLVSGYLLLQAWRMRPDARSPLEPDRLSTAPPASASLSLMNGPGPCSDRRRPSAGQRHF